MRICALSLARNIIADNSTENIMAEWFMSKQATMAFRADSFANVQTGPKPWLEIIKNFRDTEHSVIVAPFL